MFLVHFTFTGVIARASSGCEDAAVCVSANPAIINVC